MTVKSATEEVNPNANGAICVTNVGIRDLHECVV
jgi:hypothetical protein